jgi:hypothetical protein
MLLRFFPALLLLVPCRAAFTVDANGALVLSVGSAKVTVESSFTEPGGSSPHYNVLGAARGFKSITVASNKVTAVASTYTLVRTYTQQASSVMVSDTISAGGKPGPPGPPGPPPPPPHGCVAHGGKCQPGQKCCAAGDQCLSAGSTASYDVCRLPTRATLNASSDGGTIGVSIAHTARISGASVLHAQVPGAQYPFAYAPSLKGCVTSPLGTDGNPTVHATFGGSGSTMGVGLAALDDVFRVHAKASNAALAGSAGCTVSSPPSISLADPSFGLAGGGSYTMQWAVYTQQPAAVESFGNVNLADRPNTSTSLSVAGAKASAACIARGAICVKGDVCCTPGDQCLSAGSNVS